MKLGHRLAIAFALVALLTAAAVAVATPLIVGRGFARALADIEPGSGAPRVPGRAMGDRARDIEGQTTLAIILVAVGAAAVASAAGVLVAARIAAPIVRLEGSARSLAAGRLAHRSGVAGRSDELGSLARSFDAMAAAIERQDEARRRLLQDVSHELRTPLAVIDATIAAIRDGVYEHDDRHLATIGDQSRLLGRIVQDLRTVTLAEAGALPLDARPVDLDALVQRVVAAFAARAELRGSSLVAETGGDVTALADGERVEQILEALLDNALRHTPQGGRVVVSVGRTAGAAVLSVSDTGPGIRPEDLPHVFERFYRADASRDRETGGTGLGLAIVAALAAAMGGSVGAANTAAGGARLEVTLPAV